MNSAVYVPIVKGKTNDIKAIGKLPQKLLSMTKPLIEIMPVNPKKPLPIEDHVHNFCQRIRKHAPLGEIFVDFYGLLPDACISDNTNATVFGYWLLKGLGRRATPVYGLERNDDLWPLLKKAATDFEKGFAFRLRRDDLEEHLIDDTWSAIIERSAEMDLDESQIDLILDFASLENLDPSDAKEAAISFLFHNERVRHYRNIIVTASSALRNVSDVEKEGMAEVTRRELHLWAELWNDMPEEVKPTYGDYGVIHPDFSDIGPNKNMNAKIRYTAGDKLLYYRGHGLLKPVKDYEQYHNIARRVRADSRYQKRGYSFGDTYIDNCAREIIKPGDPSSWITADMSHHMAYTTQQINRLLKEFALQPDQPNATALLKTV